MKKYTVDRVVENVYAVLMPHDPAEKDFSLPLTELPIQVKMGDEIEIEMAKGKVTAARVVKRYRPAAGKPRRG
ncbi:hypothetical protein [Alteribacter natronophilus]|uniref:hypothetical protein n=1 Tax=Alteribacter natronophilus TaxID=2583810 RepID=UPI00110DADE7|nr:hypothetical protein [Alteribacter natronophilus]TMW71015.1 hypothetical protein FGB90_13660 [Alteribacter natronophilus]